MARVTDEDKVLINLVYLETGTYAETARRTGFSPSTVKKYIIPNFIPIDTIEKKTFSLDDLPDGVIKLPQNLGRLCTLSFNEIEELEEFRKELII